VIAAVAGLDGLLFTAAARAASLPTTDLALWLKADAGVEEAPGDPAEDNDFITAWRDQSGLDNDALPTPISGNPASWYEPTLKTSVVNAQPAVSWVIGPGGHEYPRLALDSPLLTGTTDFAIFAVIHVNGTDNADHDIAANYGSGVGSGGLEFRVYQNKLSLYLGGNVVFSSQDIQANNWYIVEAERSGNTFTQRINNVDEGTFTTAVGINSTLNWTIGNLPAPTNIGPFRGDIAEQIVYTDNLSQFSRWDALGYLGDKYGIAVTGIPEPASALLAASGFTAMLVRRRKRGERA
jgi:hypothetical protein